jgi:hypothetical protein
MTDEGRQCRHCIRAEMHPKNGFIHNHLYSDRYPLAAIEVHHGAYLDVWFRVAGAVTQVQVL